MVICIAFWLNRIKLLNTNRLKSKISVLAKRRWISILEKISKKIFCVFLFIC